SEETIIYLITERAQLDRIIDIEGLCKVKFTASLDTIKWRFAQRMHGKLPQPVENMLNNQYEEWKTIKREINVETTVDNNIDKESIENYKKKLKINIKNKMKKGKQLKETLM